MAGLPVIQGSTPGMLDSTQPQRVLATHDPASTLSFADYNGGPMPPQVSEPLDHIFNALKARRIAVETSPDGIAHWRFVPSAVLHGVPDEGRWPRVVNFLGKKTVMMSRDQWDIHKLDPAYACTVDVNMPSIWPAGMEHPVPISPPTTDSDIKEPKPGTGTKTQPYVVDDPDKLSVPPSVHRSPPQSRRDENRNPFAARVSSDEEMDSLFESADTTNPVDTTPKSAMPKTPSSNDQDRAHSIISISSDSGNETATPSPRKRSTSPGILPDEAGPSTPRSKQPAPRYKRRRVDSVSKEHTTPLKSEPLDPAMGGLPTASPFARSPGLPPSVKRTRPSSGSPDSPAHKRARFSAKPTPQPARDPAYSRPPNAPPIRIFLQPRSTTAQPNHQHFPESSESEADAKMPPPRPQPRKRQASDSPEIEEIPGPVPPGVKRQRTDAGDSSSKPRAANKQDRAQRKAKREKARKAARPTASLFGDTIRSPEELLMALHAEYLAGLSLPTPSGSYTAYRPVSTDYPSFTAFEPTASGSGRAMPHAQGTSLPDESGSEYESEPGIDGDAADAAPDDHEGDADAEDDGNEHAAAIEESKRKLAELERDRPLWEEAKRRRKMEEDFAQRQAEAKKLREEQRRREQAAREEARNREQQERNWQRYQDQEKRRAEQARRDAEARANARKRFENFADFQSHWSHMYGGRARHTFFTGPSTSARPTWTPSDALARYEKQCAFFDATKYTDADKLQLDAIPWPILSRSPVSMDHVDWDTVGEFFKTIKNLMSAPDYTTLVDKSHKRWHPDRWRSRTGAFRFIDGTDAQREQVEKNVNMVSQVITPLWQESR